MSFDARRGARGVPGIRAPARGLPLSGQRRDRADLPRRRRGAARRSRPENRANVKRGIYPLAEAATEAFAEARADASPTISASPTPDEVILTSGTTLGINLFAHAFGARLAEGDEIVLSELEHHSNIVPWQLLRERTGARDPGPAGHRRGPARSRPARAGRDRALPGDRGDPRLERHRRAHRARPDRRRGAGGRRPGAGRRRAAGAARAARRAGARRRRLRDLRAQDVRPDRRRARSGSGATCSPSCRRSWAAAR